MGRFKPKIVWRGQERTNGKVDVHEDKLFIRVQQAVDELGDAEELQLHKHRCQVSAPGCRISTTICMSGLQSWYRYILLYRTSSPD